MLREMYNDYVGHLFRTTNDQPFSMSSVSSAFPMMNHPAFGLYTSSSGRSEFGGLGTLGVSAALAAHSQLGTFPEWWRASEAPGRGTTAFFSPILGLPPMFTPPMQNHDSSPFHSRTPSKNGRGSSKGVNGAVNGSSVNASSGGNPAPAMPPALGASEQPKATNSSSRSRKGVQEGGQIVKEKPSQKTKDKKLRKKTMECSSNSDSESGSSSETSSEGVSSSDSDLDDEDDEEEDDDDDDQSNETDDSDSERDTRVDVGEGKKNMPKLVEDLEHQESTGNLPRGFSTESPAAAHFPIQPSSQPQSLGLVTSSSGPLVFQGPKAREEGVKQHQSVIQATGLAASVKPLALVTQPRQENSPKPLSPSPKPLCLSTSPKPLSLSTSPKPLSLSNSPQPLSLSSSPRPPSLSPSPKVKSLTPSPNPPTLSPDGVKATTRSLVEDSVSHIDFRLKQEHLKQVFPVHLKKQQESHKTQKKAVLLSLPPPKLSPEVMDSPKLANPHSNHSNLFLSSTLLGHQHSHHHPNGVIQSTVQDAPLALITKPRSQAKSPSKPSVAAPGAASDAAPVAPFSLPVNLSMGPKNHTAASMAPTRTTTSPSLTTMHIKNRVPKAMTPGKGAPQSHLVQSLVDLFRSTESDIPSSKESDDSVEDEDDEDEDEDDDDDDDDSDSPSVASCLSLKFNTPHLPIYLVESESNFGSDSDGSEDDMKDRNETGTDTEGEKIPLKLTKSTSLQNTSANHSISSSPLNLQVIKTPSMAASSALTGSGSLAYHSAPSSSFTVCTQPGSAKRRRVTDERELRVPLEFGWQRETRIKNVNGRLQGDVAYYAPCGKKLRQYPDVVKGMQWSLLKEEEVIPRILAMEGRRGRPPNPESQRPIDGSRVRRRKGRPPNVGEGELPSVTDAKLLRKLEAQEIARQAAQIKLMRKLEKQALARAAKEARKQQAIMAAEEKRKQKEQIKILKQQAKRKKKEEAANAKILEAEKRTKERERLKQEKRDEKRLNKERKLELRRLELEMAKELKKPNEDMCLPDHKPLPELSRIPGLVLPGSTFSDCLMVMQFLRSFGKVLGFDVSTDVPSLGVLQEGLLNVGESMGEVQDLLTKTSLGDHLTNVGINRDNVSEILQIYMDAHCAQTELAELAESLRTKAFQAHTPAQKASILAFLVNELACSKSVVSEIDKNIDHMTNLRRDKWVIEGKLRKLRNIHAKKTGKRESGVDEGDQAASVEELEKQIDKLTKQQSQIRRKLFEASHSLRSMMFGQDRYKRRYWVLPQCGGVFVEGMESGEGPEELQKEKERYRQHESMGTVQIKEEPPEPLEEKPLEISQEVNLLEGESAPEARNEKDSPNLFLQKPGSFSKLSKLLEVAKMSPKSEGQHQKQNGCPVTVTMVMPSPPHTGPQSSLPSSGQPAPIAPGVEPKLDPIPPLIGPHFSSPNQACSPQQSLSSDQLFRVLTEKSGHWFSLLPRSPCDESSLTSIPTPPGASPRSSAARPKSPTSSSPTASTPSASASPHNPGVIGNLALSSLQVKPGIHGVGLGYCGWPGGMSPNMTFSSSSQHPTLGPIYVPGESNGNPFLAPSVSTSKSESPVPPSEKPSSVPSPAVEVAKPQDYQTPQPIPEEMLTGWWRVADMEELRALVKALHSRGIREKALQKQIQKHMEYIAQACAKNRDAATIDMTDLEENQVTEETLEGWCVEEQAMEMDIAILQQVEELERKVTSASLQVKGWIYPEPQSEREDLVYHEHKPRTQLSMAKDKEGSNEQKESEDGNIVRRVNNPLDIAVTRLAELEKNIERRYLKSPLSTTIQIKLDNVGTVTVPAPAPSSSGDGEGGEEDIAPGMKVWRKALSEVRSAAQLALCIQQLQKSIAWERSIMKVYCQFCRKGDNEELLLLCDGCDKGCHTYCHRPKITTIPEGDWFCPACISKASGQSPKNKKLQNRAVVPGKKTTEVKRCRKPSVAGEISEDDAASSSSTPKKVMKDPKKRKVEENPPPNQLKPDSPASMKKTKIRDNDKDLILCRYQNLETFIIDVNLVFDNCEKFNEDNSDIGRAGHSMRKFFERRWTELLKTN
ncbi:bromodomain adjacent to zinc finger domain protein 2B-like [Scleropages formosus]|uniref:Bromodomain adjacent to zinc finger domain protein 2B-like n=1 Tax=Scleropages formosus TaxID=113540 RepID=A0A0P7Z3P3_SCLFO|nr:bromodomain adjacent to zinc finger domain protein 2B-like [Scleropages formosus]